MKPDWKDAPEGTCYLAMDGDGWWFWWKAKPEWDESSASWITMAANAANGPDHSGIDWDFAYDTLEAKPE